MILTSLIILLGAISVLRIGYVNWLFVKSPTNGLKELDHRLEYLPSVMTGRYFTNFWLCLGAFIYGEPIVFVWLAAIFVLVSLWDGYLYYKDGLPYLKHWVAAGVGAIAGLVFMFQPTNIWV